MRDDEWEQRLEHTRDHVRENLGGDAEDGPGDEHQNLRRLFVRYLVWDEFVAARSERSRQIQTDVQPSFEQLNTFFFQFMETGATLADIFLKHGIRKCWSTVLSASQPSGHTRIEYHEQVQWSLSRTDTYQSLL